jgi:hypothetical protein
MQVCLDAADEIKLTNPNVEYIREVLGLPKETLIKMQMGVVRASCLVSSPCAHARALAVSRSRCSSWRLPDTHCDPLLSCLQATRLKDNARCIRITIKLKDMMFNQTKVRAVVRCVSELCDWAVRLVFSAYLPLQHLTRVRVSIQRQRCVDPDSHSDPLNVNCRIRPCSRSPTTAA